MNRPFNIYDQKHLHRLRMAAAGIVRDILSALEQCDRSVLTEAIREDWWNKGRQPSGKPVNVLLKNAAKNLRDFFAKFGGSLNSMPCPGDTDDGSAEDSAEVRIEKLRDRLDEFADPGAIKQAVASNDQVLSVDWAQLCRWESLPDIRKILNSFPERVEQSSVLKIIDLAVEDPDIVRYQGVECTKPTKKCFLILKYLLTCSNHASPLNTLRKKVWDEDDDDWCAVHSALRTVRRYFEANKIPYGITGSEELRQILLKEIQPLGKARTHARKPSKTSNNQIPKRKKSPAKKKARRK